MRLPFLALLAAITLFASSAARAASDAWLPVWVSAQQLVEPRNLPPPPGFAGRALRQELSLSLGGETLRVTVDNTFGDGPLALTGAWISPSLGKGKLDAARALPLRFEGSDKLVVAPGARSVSDPVPLAVAASDRVSVTLLVDAAPAQITGHPGARTSTYLFSRDAALDSSPPADAARVERWYFLSAVATPAAPGSAAVVVLGDSIADGRDSTTDGHNRWPDQLARRLATAKCSDVAVLNQGIGGNAVLRGGLGPTALDRLDRDVLAIPGARWLILHEGVNDLGAGATAEALIAGQREIVRRARERGLRVFGATILPFAGSSYDKPAHETERLAFNRWVREGGEFDGVIDFDAALRDPENPARLAPAFDGGDHLHPGPEGYRRMAEAVDLAFFAANPR